MTGTRAIFGAAEWAEHNCSISLRGILRERDSFGDLADKFPGKFLVFGMNDDRGRGEVVDANEVGDFMRVQGAGHSAEVEKTRPGPDLCGEVLGFPAIVVGPDRPVGVERIAACRHTETR